MTKSSKVSVIIPAFDAAATIADSLKSAAEQTWGDLEIIIVNDGSTDATAEIAREFCEREPRARLVGQPNLGVAAARNRGIEESLGEWIAPLDSDDLWHPSKIELQLAAAAGAPEIGLVYNWSRVIDAEGSVVGSALNARFEGDVVAEHLRCNFIGNGSTPLIRRSALGHLRYDSQVDACADYFLQLKLGVGAHFAVVPAYLTAYRSTRTNMSSDKLRMIREVARMFELLLPDLPQQYRSEATRQMAWWRARLAVALLARGRPVEAADQMNAALAMPHAVIREGKQRFGARLSRSRAGRHFRRTRRPFFDFSPGDQLI
jgi:glycosyltransferase involved in cell wall biosynthesis